MYVLVHGARSPDDWCMVASSSPIGGSGTLQCGTRALVATWAWMGHEYAVTELMLQHLGLKGPWNISQQRQVAYCPGRTRRKWVNDRKIHKNFLSARIVISSEKLVRSSSDAAENIVRRSPDVRQSKENCRRNCVCRPSAHRRTKSKGPPIPRKC